MCSLRFIVQIFTFVGTSIASSSASCAGCTPVTSPSPVWDGEGTVSNPNHFREVRNDIEPSSTGDQQQNDTIRPRGDKCTAPALGARLHPIKDVRSFEVRTCTAPALGARLYPIRDARYIEVRTSPALPCWLGAPSSSNRVRPLVVRRRHLVAELYIVEHSCPQWLTSSSENRKDFCRDQSSLTRPTKVTFVLPFIFTPIYHYPQSVLSGGATRGQAPSKSLLRQGDTVLE